MLRPYQTKAIEAIRSNYLNGINKQLLCMATGTGKCFAPYTPILMFNGSIKPIQNIKIGDKIMGPDSMPRTVLSLGHGFDDMYEVIPVKGSSYTVNSEHILSLKLTPRFKGTKHKSINISIKDYINSSNTFKHRAKGYRTGVQFNHQNIPVDAYFLGLWLGDGTALNTSITTSDIEIETFIRMYADYSNLLVSKYDLINNAASTYHINSQKKSGRGLCQNHLLNEMRKLNIIQNKHIPMIYKVNSFENRRQLIAGYMDADGHLSKGGYEYVSISKLLAEDVAYIARSLGLACYIKECIKSDQNGTNGLYYRGYISGNIDIIPCKLARKQADIRKQIKNVLVTGINVEPRPYGEYFGFTLDKDGLFLLGDFTVVHNTEVFAHLPQETKDILPNQMMVLLHRDELAQQAYKKLIQRNPDFKVHIEAGPLHANPDADVIIGSVQTLGRKDSKRPYKFDLSHFDKWVVDEAHRSITDSYMNVYKAANLLQENDKRLLLGVTATPSRADGQGLCTLYQKIVYTYGLRTAIKDGYLVDIRGIRVDTDVSLDEVHTKGGDFDQQELAETVNNPYRNSLVCKAYIDNCENRQAIGFAVDIQHAKDLANVFQDAGINTEAVWGVDPDRYEKIRLFREGKIQVLFNAQLLTEGFDLPAISCVILAAPTKSGVVFSQRVGRGTRLCDGKIDCIILDVCDSTLRHNLVTLPTLLGMPSGLNLRGHGLVESIEIIEDKLKELPHLDFTTLKDIDKIEAFVNEVNLFEVKFPEEIDKHTTFTWHPAYTGGYTLLLPNKDSIKIEQNLLDKFEVKGYIKGKKYKGERDSLEEALSAADSLVIKEAPECLLVVKREAEWHNLPATEKQLKRIKKMFKGKQIPENLSRGAAFKLIGSNIAGKESKHGKH